MRIILLPDADVLVVRFSLFIVINSLNRNDAKTFLNLAYQSDLELIAPKSAWSTPELSPAFRRNSSNLPRSINKSKKYYETSFSFENPGGQTSTV